ncbi:MAG: radical SAM protein [Candidatus Ratteibacteria bacterium]|nr:radical SAM protein [Candidatus Ratteibacteria bacterium]
MKSKIVMIYPPTGNIVDYNTPTGTLYVATYLQEKGYDVRFIDCSVEENWHERVLEEVKDALCFGSYCMSIHIKHLIPLLKDVKRINPAIKTVLGGAHPTLFPEQTAADPLVDFAVIGEGEETMLELVQMIEAGKTDFSEVKGISYKHKGKALTTPAREFIDMDTLPFVDWSLMSQKALDSMKTKIARIQTSRGCPFHCSFCINVVSKNGKMRYRSPQKVVDEIEHMIKTYGVKRFGIRDEVFLLNRQKAKEIAQGIIDRGLEITWLANPHVKFLRESWIDDEYLDLLKRSGCTKLQCGGESGNQRILDMLHKTVTPEDTLNFVKRTKKHGIISLVAFMTGLPTETRAEQLQTLKLIWGIMEIAPETFINGAAMFRPYPGGELYEQCVRDYNLKMPITFRGWMDVETIGGTKPPWIKDLYFSQNLWMHTTFARYENLGQLTGICKKIYKKYGLLPAIGAYLWGKVSHYRLKHNYYGFLIDFWLLQAYWHQRGEIPELS